MAKILRLDKKKKQFLLYTNKPKTIVEIFSPEAIFSPLTLFRGG